MPQKKTHVDIKQKLILVLNRKGGMYHVLEAKALRLHDTTTHILAHPKHKTFTENHASYSSNTTLGMPSMYKNSTGQQVSLVFG